MPKLPGRKAGFFGCNIDFLLFLWYKLTIMTVTEILGPQIAVDEHGDIVPIDPSEIEPGSVEALLRQRAQDLSELMVGSVVEISKNDENNDGLTDAERRRVDALVDGSGRSYAEAYQAVTGREF